ncbi:hypothetical protein PV325_010555 [Microctonus aethiopoides]|uniref:Zinc finger CCHC domain-containing protein 7 n=1 Tax=Microctonus aethiopoides TaxID=144406 RepID=A0AA39C510_9HYME|nr:hypothetical protein PV325_010555 [Microctonus aethiopoides]KAK0157988.1 hypothetical protein PV328_011657 [Microctonus aethiopoides]
MDHRDIDGGPGYDADLESRLYAEIHYSNDTYPDQLPSNASPGNNNHNGHGYPSNNPIPNIMNQYPSMSSRYRFNSNAHPKPHPNSWGLNSRPNCEPHNSAMYSRNYQEPGISSNYNHSSHQQSSLNYSRNNEMYSKKPRPLMDNFAYSYPSLPHQYDYTNDRMSYPQLANDYENPPIRNRIASRSSVPPAPHRRNNNIDVGNHKQLNHNSSRRAQTQKTVGHKKNSSPAKKKIGRNKASNSNKITNSHRENAITATNSKITFDNSIEDIRPPGTDETTSKYDVTAKSNQPQEINPSVSCNSVDIPSDSDESIFEVPVPPKPKPLIIDLKDSDEASNSDDDEEQSPVVMSEKSQSLQQQQEQPLSSLLLSTNDKDTNSSSTIIQTVISSSESTQELPDTNMISPTINTNTEELSNDIDTISNNIIINCTQVATGVTTLADIKRIRESTNAPPTTDGLSDDSMTESEAMKWGQIEGQMGGNNGDKSTDSEWNQLPRNSENNIDKTTNAQSTLKSVEIVARVIDETPSSGTRSTSINAKRKRSQRSESGSEINNELNNSEKNVDRNRTKKPAKEKSFEESLHEPRPKKLELFYNEPRPGIIMLDVHKIQSRMPSDPNRWAILDADKGYTVNMRDRKKKCSLCHREGHLRDKCPNHRQVPTCHMCGEVGHFEPRCPHSMCLTCGTKFSSYRKTCENCRNTKCSMCKSVGHTNDTCPDLWRRYHQTTPPNASVKSSRETGTSKLSSSKSPYIHNDDRTISEIQSNNEIIPSVNQSESSNLNSSKRDKNLVGVEIKSESIESLPSSPSSSSSKKVLNGYIFFHWKSSNLWPDNLIQNYTRLNDIEGSIIDGLIAGTIFPAFITELDDICPFELIMGYHNGFAQMFLQTYNEQVLELLKKLIIMWLIRNDDEKWLMIGSATLPINRRKLLNAIKERQVLARSTWSTADQENMCDLLKQIDSRKKIIEDIYKSYPIVRPSDVQLSLEKVETTTNDIKWRVVLCLYYCEWIKGAKEIIDNFHTMIMELERNKYYIEIPVPMYLKILQFCNEVFTPHTSQHIIDGAKRCMESMSKQNENKKKVSSPLSKNKVIMQTLYKLMFEYELCKRKKKLSNRRVMKKFDDIENLLLNCPENDKYIKSLESYRELLDGDGSIQQLTVILGYFTSLLRKKLGLSEEWRKKTVQKICKDLEEIGHLNKLSDLNNKTVAHGSIEISSDSDSDIIEVSVEEKKIEELTISDDEKNKILNDEDDDEDYDDSELIRTLKEIMKTSTTATSDANNKENIFNKSTNANETQTNSEDDNEEAILLSNLAMLEELIDDPELQ